jgi:hypothetical protein
MKIKIDKITASCAMVVAAMVVSMATAGAAVTTLNSGVDGNLDSRGGNSFTSEVEFQYGLSYWEWTRSVVKFDLSSVPAYTNITSAKLKFTITTATNNSSEVTSVYKEGVNWTTSATWTTSNGTTAWPSYAGYPNIDYSVAGGGGALSSPLATTTIATGTTGIVELDVTSAVQDWLINSQPNYGFFLKTGPSIFGTPASNFWNIQLGSFDNVTASNRPTLVIDGVVPEPASLGLLALGAIGLLRRRRR